MPSSSSIPDAFIAGEAFEAILAKAGLEIDLDVFKMLDEARLRVIADDLSREEYELLAESVHDEIMRLLSGGARAASTRNAPVSPRSVPLEPPVGEKVILEQTLKVAKLIDSASSMRVSTRNLGAAAPKFENRILAVYSSAVVVFDTTSKRKVVSRMNLTNETWVQDSNSGEFAFVITDERLSLNVQTASKDVKEYIMLVIAQVVRKLSPDAALTDAEQDRIAEDMADAPLLQGVQGRLTDYKKNAKNRRVSMAFRRKRTDHNVPSSDVVQQMKEQEAARQQKLEDLQRRLEEAETQVEEERARADRTLEELQAESRMREQALISEKEEIEAKLKAKENVRRQSMMPGGIMQPQFDVEAFKKEKKALEAKLAALQDALNLDMGDLDWDGTLEDAEEKMMLLVPSLGDEDESKARAAQAEFDQWDKIIRNHADYKKREDEKWVVWEKEQKPKNEAALTEMRNIVPPEVLTGVDLKFLQEQCKLPKKAANRVYNTKIYHFLYMPVKTIAKLHIADLSSRYVAQGLDIREMRAIYCCIPDEFELDSDGRKKIWRENFKNRLKQMTDKQAKGSLMRNEELHSAWRKDEPKKAKKKLGGGGGKNVKAGAGLAGLFGGGPRGPPPLGGKSKMPAASNLQNALANKLGEGGKMKRPPAMVAESAGASKKTEKNKEMKDLLGMVKKTKAKKKDKKLSAVGEAGPASLKSGKKAITINEKANTKSKFETNAPPPMVDIGGKFNAPSSPKRMPKLSANFDGLSKDAHELMARAKMSFGYDVEVEKIEAFDFQANYAKKSTWVDDGIGDVVKNIIKFGKESSYEDVEAEITFQDLYDNTDDDAKDKLVGVLMRGKKKSRITYAGDLLFLGVHSGVLISALK